MTVWVYVDTSRQVGDVDHLKVFATAEAACQCVASFADAHIMPTALELLDRASIASLRGWS